MLLGRGYTFHWFDQPTRIDWSVGWRYLADAPYRTRVQVRWDRQPAIMTLTEVLAGIASVLIPLGMAAGGFWLLLG